MEMLPMVPSRRNLMGGTQLNQVMELCLLLQLEIIVPTGLGFTICMEMFGSGAVTFTVKTTIKHQSARIPMDLPTVRSA
jgi:hypothetical protein